MYWCTTTLGPTGKRVSQRMANDRFLWDTRFGTWFCHIWWLKIIIPGCSVQSSELPVSTCSKDCSYKIQQSHNALCNRNGHICAHICYKVVHYGIRDQCIMGFMRMVYWATKSRKIALRSQRTLTRIYFNVSLFNDLFFPHITLGGIAIVFDVVI